MFIKIRDRIIWYNETVNGKIIHKFSKEKSFNDVDTSKALTYKAFSSYDISRKKKKEEKSKKPKKKIEHNLLKE